MIPKYNCVFLSLALLFCGSHANPKDKGSAKYAGPNIVLILADDQDSFLGGVTPMKLTQSLIAKKGVTFTNSFVTTPICCPSRASLLTGMYPHNHPVKNNSVSGNCSSKHLRGEFEPYTFAAILQKKANYKTFYAGKYMNQYGMSGTGGPQYVPQGWNEWNGLVGNSKYFNFTLSHNGKPVNYFNGEYLTDVISNMALKFMDEEFKKGMKNPFLMVLAPPAPHAPFEPAPRHRDTYPDLKALVTPNFNMPAGKDKHWLLRMPPKTFNTNTLARLDNVYRRRWQTLLSVDEMVEAVVKSLLLKKILNNTYVIFTSDNGFHIGQFGQACDKRQPYETDIRVPLMIRGPQIPDNLIIGHPVLNIDIAPTILQLANIKVADYNMDGFILPIFPEPIAELLSKRDDTNAIFDHRIYDRTFLVEYIGEGRNDHSKCPGKNDSNLALCDPTFQCKCEDSRNNTYECVRHIHPKINILYCEFHDDEEFLEAYDMMEDPYQITNIVFDVLPSIRYKYKSTLDHLRVCKGIDCNKYHKILQ